MIIGMTGACRCIKYPALSPISSPTTERPSPEGEWFQTSPIGKLIFGWFGTGLLIALLFQSFAMDLIENFAPLIGMEILIEPA